MKTHLKLVLSGIGIAALTGLTVGQAKAFAPIDWLKAKLTPAQQSQMETYHSQRDEALAQFLGKPLSEIEQALASGKKPRDLMDATKLAEWRASRQMIKNQHQQELGMSQYGHEQGRGQGLGRGFGRTNSN